MARTSFEKQAFDAALCDIRIRTMDIAMRGFFFTLMGLFRTLAVDGRIVFGSGRVPCLAAVVADSFCGMDETQFITHLKTQCETQLFAWDADSQTLVYEPEKQLSARAIANRENGKKGGRPRKNAITERNDPAQRHMPPMAISGGLDVQKSKPIHETQSPIAKLETNNSILSKAKLREPSKEEINLVFQRIGPVAFEAAGFDPARDYCDWSIARQWASDGLSHGLTADEIERIVVEKVTVGAQRARQAGKTIQGLVMFRKSVPEALARGVVPPKKQTIAEQNADQAFIEALQAWQRNGAQGPRPDLKDFRAQVAA